MVREPQAGCGRGGADAERVAGVELRRNAGQGENLAEVMVEPESGGDGPGLSDEEGVLRCCVQRPSCVDVSELERPLLIMSTVAWLSE